MNADRKTIQWHQMAQAACDAARAAENLWASAQTRQQKALARLSSQEAGELTNAAYAEMLSCILHTRHGLTLWRTSTRNSRFPSGVWKRDFYRGRVPSQHALFDHPIVFRMEGTKGPDSPRNTAIIGRPYPIQEGEHLLPAAREHAEWLSGKGWGVWWRPDLSTWYSGWTQLVVAAQGLQASAAAFHGFIPVASPYAGAGATVWDEWTSQLPGVLRDETGIILPRRKGGAA